MIDSRPVSYKKVSDMPEMPAAFNSISWNKTGTWRYIKPRYQDKLAPCREGCPAGEDIEKYIELIKEERYVEAYMLIMEENPFPSVCGRVCYHPCEDNCNRRNFDREVSINSLERLVADFARTTKKGEAFLAKERQANVRNKMKRKVAIVGSGPAGLTCAFHLARIGYNVTVYEALSEIGGILAVGIPDYRLPKDILKWEINQILSLGVEVKTNLKIGKDIEFEKIRRGHDCVFLATGAHKNRKLGIPGDDLPGVYSGLDFLRRVNTGQRVELGEFVAVIGGGNTAIDVARSALRLKKKVKILYRRTKNEMPANEEEISEAEREGAILEFLAAPVRVIEENGRIIGMECVRMRLGNVDSGGRRTPVPVKESNFIIEADNIITATGEETDFSYLPEDIRINEGAVEIDMVGATSINGVFAGGDIIDQPRTVVHAIGSGKRGAIAIDCFIKGKNPLAFMEDIELGSKGSVSMRCYTDGAGDNEKNRTIVGFENINLDYFEVSERGRMPYVSVKNRLKGFKEVKLGLSREIALRDAERCFSCGSCTCCDNCYIFCPDISVLRKEGEEGYIFDYDHCKGCGICAEECPRYVISMEEEER